MSVQAQYVSIPKNGAVTIQTANTARDGTGTLGIVATAPAIVGDGTRFDRIVIQAGGTTTANVVRLFLTQGNVGQTISSITAVATTATVTTAVPHGLATGALITLQSAVPVDYNVTATAITVTGASTFTFTMLSTPTVTTAQTVGNFSWTPAVPITRLLREFLIPAATPSTTQAAYVVTMSSGSAVDIGYMPLILQAGYSLRASTNNAEVYYVLAANSGDLA